MKTLIATFALALTTLTTTAQKRLVADIYPDAVTTNTAGQDLILTRNSGYSTANAEVYLVKDEKTRVMAFYHKKQRKAEKTMPCANGDQYLEIQTQQNNDHSIRSAGVVISSNPHKKTAIEDIGGFDELRELVKSGFHPQEEFDLVYEKYKHLNHTFFNITSEEDTINGGFLNFQEQLYKAYAGKVKPVDMAAQLEALVVNIEELTDQGKYQEAHDLTGKLRDAMERAASNTSQTDTWAVWMEYFGTLEKNAYRTMIIIHKPIAQWHTEEAIVLQK
jgi:hypothetical protein